MKLILRQYLADLKERGELDSILPEVLSELGFNVLSKPSRGTRQNGVDVAAVGKDDEDSNRKKLFLFTIKSGDLTRRGWDDGSPHAVRQSLNDILDVYIDSRIAKPYQGLSIVICLCIGGEIREDAQTQWIGFTNRNAKTNVDFRFWNGDKIAGLMASRVLGKEFILPGPKTSIQKAIAMVDHPDVSYKHFTLLVNSLLENVKTPKTLMRSFRQIYICCWVLYVWAREEKNLDAPFRSSEYMLLRIWNRCRDSICQKGRYYKKLSQILMQAIELHVSVAEELLITKLTPYLKEKYAMSLAVNSPSYIDVNLVVFEYFGRLCLLGIWQHWTASSKSIQVERVEWEEKRNHSLDLAEAMIARNPTLLSPIRDDFMIEISLFMILAQACDRENAIRNYFQSLIEQLSFALECRQDFPIPTQDYNHLLRHADEKSDEVFKDQTSASVLFPLLVRTCDELCLFEERVQLLKQIREILPHTTLQMFLVNEESEEKIWNGDFDHGTSVIDVPVFEDGDEYKHFVQHCAGANSHFDQLSSTVASIVPLHLVACRHFRFPTPPQMWFVKPLDIGKLNRV